MKLFLALSAIIVASQALPHDFRLNQWNSFKVNHSKEYASAEEEQLRFKIFSDNLEIIEKHNALYAQGLKSYQMGVNQFTDLTKQEFKQFLGLNNGRNPLLSLATETFQLPAGVEAPTAQDWRQSGAVTPVKNQGQCGSCWAFSVTGTIEGAEFLKNGKLISLSEQQLVDCAGGKYRNLGCNGGYMNTAVQYVIDNGITTEAQYPYTARDGTCKYSKNQNVLPAIKKYVSIPEGDEEALKAAVGTVGPVSIGVYADPFMYYSSGIFDDDECGDYPLDHGVLAVGYGSQGGKDYWIVKNSWGASWGEQGYIRIARNSNNRCGVASEAIYPVF